MKAFRFQILAVMLTCCASPHATPATSWAATNEAPGKQEGKNLLEYLLGPQSVEGCPADGLLKLTDSIDDDLSGKLVRQIEACKGRAIALEIDSPGGSVFAALQIQKALERHDRPTFCVVDGLAASAAFVTLQSCTYRYATDRSMLMVHHASLSAKGQETELRNGADAVRVVDWGMIEHCAKRMGMNHAEFESRVSDGKEWYLSQADALQYRAIDGPADSVAVVTRLAGEG